MNIKNVQKNEKPLLSRTEITGELEFSGVTPSKETLKKKLAEQLKAKEELLVIKKIVTNFGEEKATFIAYLYTNKEEMKIIEPRKKKEKQSQEKKEAPKEEKTPEQKKQESQEKKETSKEEKTPEAKKE